MKIIIRLVLLPFSCIYWIVTYIRNKLFDVGYLKSEYFSIPIISVGNITVGGTGKTPHIEYLVRLLNDTYKTAILSRGYGRKTTGYVVANRLSSVSEIGDEPYQMHSKFSKITVAVCEKRVNGIRNLLTSISPQVILLDDAYQHRYVTAGCSILLVDYNRPLWNDCVFPAGRLREGKYARKRADIVIVTKTPTILNTREKAEFAAKLRLNYDQSLYFSQIQYGTLVPVFENTSFDLNSTKNALAITGIAKAAPFIMHLEQLFETVHHIKFSDHHNFTREDILTICKGYSEVNHENLVLVTTEKDAVRLRQWDELKNLPLFYIPITIEIYGNEKPFDTQILKYIEQFSNTIKQ